MTYKRILDEVNQDHTLRRNLYLSLEEQLGGNKKVIAFFTSFTQPALIVDQDADMLEEVLQNSDLNNKELVFIINSAGGEALAAERIVNVCRSYSKGSFSVIIPKMAKSAATMVCFGANRLGMSKTSELGPIDPQIPIQDEQGIRYLAAHEIIESYKELMSKANRSRGRIEPYLQQLARFDARDIRRIVSEQELSESIAVNCLRGGIFEGLSPRQVKNRIKPFLEPRYTKVHGRPIYHDVAKKCGLRVDLHGVDSIVWRSVWQLYVRLNWQVTNKVGKIIESADQSWTASIPSFPTPRVETKGGTQR